MSERKLAIVVSGVVMSIMVIMSGLLVIAGHPWWGGLVLFLAALGVRVSER